MWSPWKREGHEDKSGRLKLGGDLEARSCQGDGQSGEQGGGTPGEQAQCRGGGDTSGLVVVQPQCERGG